MLGSHRREFSIFGNLCGAPNDYGENSHHDHIRDVNIRIRNIIVFYTLRKIRLRYEHFCPGSKLFTYLRFHCTTCVWLSFS